MIREVDEEPGGDQLWFRGIYATVSAVIPTWMIYFCEIFGTAPSVLTTGTSSPYCIHSTVFMLALCDRLGCEMTTCPGESIEQI